MLLSWGARGLLLLVAAVWLGLTRLATEYGARLLPDAVRHALSIDVYLALMQLCSTAAGLGLLALLARGRLRGLLGLGEGPRGRGLVVAGLLVPLVFVVALGLGIYVALPTLLEEFQRGGAAVSRQNLGEVGRVVRQSPVIVTVLWVVLIAPVGEELLFRGAIWGALRELTRREGPGEAPPVSASEVSLEGMMDDGPLLRGARSAGRWVLDGGLATALSTAIFAGMHAGTPGGAGIMLVVSTVVLGLALGTLRQVTGGLVVPIAFHAGYNLLGLGHARKWFVSELFPVDFGVPRLLVVAGVAGLLGAVAVALATRRRGGVAAALLVLLAGREAEAGGLVGEGPQRRVELETALVVWDHESHVEHLLIAARASGLTGPGGYLVALPRDAAIDRSIEGVSDGISRLLPPASPLPQAAGEQPALAPRPGGLADLCKTWKLTCQAPSLAWSGEILGKRELAVLPLPAPDKGVSTTAYAHFRLDAPLPFVPFAEPIDDGALAPEPPEPGPDHPPRVRVWVELFNESPVGRWEKQMDAAGEAQGEALAGCYSKALAQRRRLAGDLHVQLRMGADHLVTDEEERASSKPLEPVARCFAAAMTRGAWPKNPFNKAIRFEVHASLRPPAATTRRLLVVVLSTHDAEPRLGAGDDPRVVPDLRPLASLEPEPAALAAAFPEATRKTLGLDPSRRFRLIAFETGADPHSVRDDIVLRLLSLPAPRPGEAPLPVVARGDRASLAAPAPAPRWWQRRRTKIAALLLVAVGLALGVAWRDRR